MTSRADNDVFEIIVSAIKTPRIITHSRVELSQNHGTRQGRLTRAVHLRGIFYRDYRSQPAITRQPNDNSDGLDRPTDSAFRRTQIVPRTVRRGARCRGWHRNFNSAWRAADYMINIV